MHPSFRHRLISNLSIFFISLVMVRPLHASEHSWMALQDKGARIDHVEIRVDDVFDLSKPGEDTIIGRIANFIHITTRKKVISKTMLFSQGDPVDWRIIHESERLLRSLPYIRDAEIIPLVSPAGSVTAAVHVHDAWTINGGLKFHSVGGETSGGVKIEERNFLGYGKQISFDHEQNSIRSSNAFGYADPQLFWSRWTLSINYAEFSDGSGKDFTLEHPFYSLETPWAFGTQFSQSRSSGTLFNKGETALSFPVVNEDWSIFASHLYRFSHHTAWRFGLEVGSTTTHYGDVTVINAGLFPDPDIRSRKFRGILARWEMIQDRFKTYKDIMAIDRTEDYNIGWEARIKGGYYFRSWGSSANAAFAKLTLSRGLAPGEKKLILLRGNFRGRREGSEFRNLVGDTSITYYDQRFPYQTIASNLSFTAGSRLDPEDTIYLGGSQGLRGYPNYFKAGDRRWIASVEDRIVTGLDILGLVRMGFVLFADAGSAHNVHTGKMSKVYADVGGGFRLGNLKSAFGRVIVVAVAFPLVEDENTDSYQIIVGDVLNF